MFQPMCITEVQPFLKQSCGQKVCQRFRNVPESQNEIFFCLLVPALDTVFLQNYQSDPALSWQYFGSDTGIMRHFPAKRWESHGVDVYDCRKRSWYIETATCSKDIVILLDNSGSMTGYRNFLAQLTVKSILDTFSNNDYINILVYSKNVTNLVPCFNVCNHFFCHITSM